MASLVPMRGLRMSDELYLKLRHIAAEEHRSYNQQAVFVLAAYVAEYEAKHGEITVDCDAPYQ